MPPIELWGPATWTLFHVLAEKVNERIYPRIAGQLFDVVKRICSALPCPECAHDASQFLAKIKIHELKTKNDFKNMIYMFHNYVNVKKRKPLFKFISLEIYKKYNIVSVFNRFISFYHTKGNMRLLAESFQRQLIVRNVREWFSRNICFFVPCQQNVSNVQEPVVVPVVQENVVGISSEEIVVSEATVSELEATVSELEATLSEKEAAIEEPVLEEPAIEEPAIEEPVLEEPVLEATISKTTVLEVTVSEATVSEEATVLEVTVSEEATVLEAAIEEPILEEPVVSELEVVLEKPVLEEPIVEENVLSEEATVLEAEPVLEEPIVEENVLSEEENVREAILSEVKEQTKPKRGRKKKVV
jgi:hypothetical protein